MVFYTQFLPTELWFIIYRKEHEIYQHELNNELEFIYTATSKANRLLGCDENRIYKNKNGLKPWTIVQYMRFIKEYNNWTWTCPPPQSICFK